MLADTTLEGKINDAVAPSLGVLGYELVRIKMITIEDRKTLQVMIDRTDMTQVGVDDCQKASNQISAVLDVEDFISEKYHLEVSSPGIDRPLTRLKDFKNFKDLEAKIETFDKIGESRKFRGKLLGVDGDNVMIATNVVTIDSADEQKLAINFENIKNAKLVLNDELLAMHKSTNI